MQEKGSLSLLSLSIFASIIFITLQVGGTISYPIWVLFLPTILVLGLLILMVLFALIFGLD